MPHPQTYHVAGRVQKKVGQSLVDSPFEVKLEAVNINDAMEQFKIRAAQAGWQRAWIDTVTAIKDELIG